MILAIVKVAGKSSYVSALCIPFVFTFFSHPVVSASTASEPICVIQPNVVLRKGPGKNFATSWSVPKFMPLLKIDLKSDKKGTWYKVQDLEGETHWVSSKSVSRKTACAVVKTKTAKLRMGPGPGHPLADLTSVDRYTPFKKTDRDGEWIQVRDSFSGVYWVHETNVWIPVVRTKMSL